MLLHHPELWRGQGRHQGNVIRDNEPLTDVTNSCECQTNIFTLDDLLQVKNYFLWFIIRDSSIRRNSYKASFQCTHDKILSFDIDGRLNMCLIVSVKLYTRKAVLPRCFRSKSVVIQKIVIYQIISIALFELVKRFYSWVRLHLEIGLAQFSRIPIPCAYQR